MTCFTFKSHGSWIAILFFVVVAIGVGLGLHSVLPPIKLMGLSDKAPNLGTAISSYIGGLGISFLLGGTGALGGIIVRHFLTRAIFKNRSSDSSAHQAVVAGVCLVIGAAFAAWYGWSFMHST